MDENKTENELENNESASLESPSTTSDSPATENTSNANQQDASQSDNGDVAAPPGTIIATKEKIVEKKHKSRGIEKLFSLNIYLLGFILLLIIAGIITYISYNRNKAEEVKQEALVTEPLSQETLDQLRQTDVRVGDPQQVLSVESNAIFAGKVLVRDSLEVAGELKVGGPLNLPGLTVSGTGTFDQLQAQTLDIAGNGNVQGQLTVGQGITVGGNLSVAGSLTAAELAIQNLQVSGDLKLARHIDAGGGTPGKTNGSALGGGGTASISGTDTAGTVNVNTGSGPSSGCFATITFTQRFNATPHVVVTPVGGGAANVRHYINRSSTGFSICSANTPPSGQSFAFDYIVIE